MGLPESTGPALSRARPNEGEGGRSVTILPAPRVPNPEKKIFHKNFSDLNPPGALVARR